MLDTVNITPEPDVRLLLDGKPFERSITRLEIETDIEEHGDPSLEPIIQDVRRRTLRLYDGERMIAATGSFDIDPTTRTISLLKNRTTFY